jgi:hypothetical protein
MKTTEYHILDYKFIKEPLEKELLQQIYSGIKWWAGRSLDWWTQLLSLQHTAWDIQVLDGRRWQEGEKNDLWLLLREAELVHTIPMKIWVTTDGVLHAI